MRDLVAVVDLDDAGAPAAVDHACARVGFFQVAGHGIADGVIDGLLDAMGRFFALPEEAKQACVPPSMSINRGWSPLGRESLAYSLGVEAPPDLFEAFNIGPEVDGTDPIHAAHRHGFFAPNLWPELPGFREAFTTYFDAVADLSRRLARVMALGLGMPEDFFDRHTTHSPDVLRVNWYDRADGSVPVVPGQQRMGAHTDYGVLTVLLADRVPGSRSWRRTASGPACSPRPAASW